MTTTLLEKEKQTTHFSFSSKGSEYFAIAIVNFLLTVLTLGRCYPWAKAKSMQYLYRKTELAGTPFVFHEIMKRSVFILLFLLCGVFSAEAQIQPSHLVGQPIYPFAFQDLNNVHFDSEALKGKVLLLNLWATSCKPCILEMPTLNELKRDYEGKDVLFISMALDDKASIKKFLKRHSFDFVILPSSANYMIQFGNTIPQTILVDKTGIVRELKLGTLPAVVQKNEKGENTYIFRSDALRLKIDELLAE